MQDSGQAGRKLSRFSIFGGGETKFEGLISGGRLIALFGGGEVNLSDAKLPKEGTKISVFSIFGGYELRVPQDWRVDAAAVSLFGGISDKRPRATGEPSGTLKISGLTLFGGLDVRNP